MDFEGLQILIKKIKTAKTLEFQRFFVGRGEPQINLEIIRITVFQNFY